MRQYAALHMKSQKFKIMAYLTFESRNVLWQNYYFKHVLEFRILSLMQHGAKFKGNLIFS